MAKQFDKIIIPLELQVQDDGAAKKLEQEIKGLEKVAANGLVYQINVDEKNFANVATRLKELSSNGDKVVISFDSSQFQKNFGTAEKQIKDRLKILQNMINDTLKSLNGESKSNSNIKDIIAPYEKKIEEVKKLNDKLKSKYSESDNYDKENLKNLYKLYKNNNNQENRNKFMAAYENYTNNTPDEGQDFYFAMNKKTHKFKDIKKEYEDLLSNTRLTDKDFAFQDSLSEQFESEKAKITSEIKEIEEKINEYRNFVRQLDETQVKTKENQTEEIKNKVSEKEKTSSNVNEGNDVIKSNEISITPVISEGSVASIKAKIENELSNINIGIAPIETNSEIESFKNSVNDLVTSIKEIGTAYQTSVNDINSGTTTQIESINKVKAAITELGSSLELVGVKTLNELPQYKEQMAQIQAEQDKLAKEKEIFQKLQEKKDKASKSGSKDKTEELTDTEKLKKAFDKTKGWTLDESSIQKQSNGITTYIAELEKAEGEAEKFLLTVGNVNDIITKNGTINKKDYLNKAQLLSPTTEDIEVKGGSESSSVIEKTIDDITRLKEIANNTVGFNIDESSIVKADDGIISFKANIANAKGELKELNYTIQDFSLVTDKSNGGFSSQFRNTGKTDNQLKEQEEKIKVAEKLNKLNSAVDKTDNFILESSNIDSSGIVTFIGYLQTADGEVKKLSYSVKDLQSVLSADGGFDKDFIGSGNLSNIEKTLDKFKTQTSENKTNQVLGVDNTAGLEKAKQLEAEINELISSENIAEEQKKAILLEVVAAKEKEAEIYDIYDKKNGASQNKFEKTKNKYNSILDYVGYEDDKNSSFSNLNSNMTILDQASNKIITVKEKMEQLKTTADELYDRLSNGQFESKNVFDQTVQELQDTMKAMENLYNNPIFQNTNKDGSNYWKTLFNGENLSSISNQEVESTLGKYLEAENRIIEKVRYDSAKRTATASIVNDDGKIEKVTMSLRSYTDAAGQAQVAVHKLNVETGKEYLTSGQKWVDGVKKKFASLSQYVTGLTLVTSAWSKIKEGFSFVKSLDSSLTTINQTMNTTQEQLDDLGKGAIDAGKDLSTSAENVLDAAAIYANANETTESVLEKAKPTVMLANASGGDVTTASDQIQGV